MPRAPDGGLAHQLHLFHDGGGVPAGLDRDPPAATSARSAADLPDAALAGPVLTGSGEDAEDAEIAPGRDVADGEGVLPTEVRDAALTSPE